MQDKKRIFIETKEFTPVYGTEESAGFDLKAYLPDGDVVLTPGETKVVSSGIKMIIPNGYEVQLRSRSGLTLKNGIVVAQGTATIDCDFRDTVGLILHNQSNSPFTITHGMRVCQGILAPVTKALFEEIDEVPSDTERGTGKYGSTGTH